MKKVLLIILAYSLAGCTSNRFAVDHAATTNFGKFGGLEIPEFKSNVAGADAKKIAGALNEQLKAKIENHNKKTDRTPIFSRVDLDASTEDNFLVAQCTLISHEKGNRAARYFVGFGAGKAYSTAKCEFIDKMSSAMISEATFDGELGIGVFGGSASEATSAMVNLIVKYIEINY